MSLRTSFLKKRRLGKLPRAPAAITQPFVAQDQEWFGQVYELHFPVPINFGQDVIVSGCRARFGVSHRFRSMLLGQTPRQETMDQFLSGVDLELALNTEGEDSKTADFPDESVEPRSYTAPKLCVDPKWQRVHRRLATAESLNQSHSLNGP